MLIPMYEKKVVWKTVGRIPIDPAILAEEEKRGEKNQKMQMRGSEDIYYSKEVKGQTYLCI